MGLLIRRETNAGVVNLKIDPIFPQGRLVPYTQRNHTVRGEFSSVAEHVDQYLTHAQRIAVHGARIGLILDPQPITILFQQWLDGVDHLIDHPNYLKRLDFDLQLTRLDPRQVKQIVDDYQQVHSGCADAPEIDSHDVGAFVDGDLLKHFAVANDRVERRTQLVTHVRQECALGPTRLFGGISRRFRLVGGSRELSSVLRKRRALLAQVAHHLIKRALQKPDLIGTSDPYCRFKVAVGHGACCCGQLFDGLDNASSHQQRCKRNKQDQNAKIGHCTIGCPPNIKRNRLLVLQHIPLARNVNTLFEAL